MASARELQPGRAVRLTGTQMLHHYDDATGHLSTDGAGSRLVVVSVGDDDDEAGACLIVFAADGREVRLTCAWESDFTLA